MNSNNNGKNFGVLKTTCCCGGLMIFFIASLILLPYELFFISAIIILYFLHILENKMNNTIMRKPQVHYSEKENDLISEPLFVHQKNSIVHNAAPKSVVNTINEVDDTIPKSLIENLECVLVDE